MDMIEEDPLDCNSDSKDVEADLLGKDLVSAQQPLTIVEDEASLSPGSETIPRGLLDNGDEEITYEIRPGEMTYRVVSVGAEGLTDGLQQIVATNGTSFNNSSHPQGVQALLTNAVDGQLFVIGSPSEVFPPQNQRNIVPRVTQSMQIDSGRGGTSSPLIKPRDDRRRATHNEVERRRRDKINNWIMKLSKIIPEFTQDTGKGSFETQSKGGILAKACDYIMELRTSNQRLMECSKENEQLVSELDSMAHQVETLRSENEQLRAQLVENGIHPCIKPLDIT